MQDFFSHMQPSSTAHILGFVPRNDSLYICKHTWKSSNSGALGSFPLQSDFIQKHTLHGNIPPSSIQFGKFRTLHGWYARVRRIHKILGTTSKRSISGCSCGCISSSWMYIERTIFRSENCASPKHAKLRKGQRQTYTVLWTHYKALTPNLLKTPASPAQLKSSWHSSARAHPPFKCKSRLSSGLKFYFRANLAAVYTSLYTHFSLATIAMPFRARSDRFYTLYSGLQFYVERDFPAYVTSARFCLFFFFSSFVLYCISASL